jgi:cytochrome c-type biogenesis protein CcmE
MNQTQRNKMKWLGIGTLLIAIVVALVAYALKQNISLYFTPSQIMANDAHPGQWIRAGGMVVKGSVKRSKDLAIEFLLTDYQAQIKVQYQGILPDLFREGQGIVVRGRVGHHHEIKALEVLAKHDENYMPPEVQQSLRATT